MMKKSFRFGYVKELDIPLIVESEPRILSGYKLAMITVIDSSEDVIHMTSVARLLHEQGVTTMDSQLVVPCELVPELVAFETNLFNGFDEIWFFEHPPRGPRPGGIGITSTRALDRDEAGRVAAWMDASGAGLGLGDGDGLNYATFDPRIADVLESWPSHGSPGTGG
jgi:hypothetical protein